MHCQEAMAELSGTIRGLEDKKDEHILLQTKNALTRENLDKLPSESGEAAEIALLLQEAEASISEANAQIDLAIGLQRDAISAQEIAMSAVRGVCPGGTSSTVCISPAMQD